EPATCPTAARNAEAIACARAIGRLPATMTARPSAATVVRRASARTATMVRSTRISPDVRLMPHDYGPTRVTFRTKREHDTGVRVVHAAATRHHATPRLAAAITWPAGCSSYAHESAKEATPAAAQEGARAVDRCGWRPDLRRRGLQCDGLRR